MEIVKSIDLENGKFIFANKDVLIIIDNDNIIWFKGTDIARILEYKNPNRAICDNISDENKKNFKNLDMSQTLILNIHPNTTFINESALYKLIFRSKMPKAEMFTDWVTNEVLPSIRKNGEYRIKNFYELKIDKLQKTIEDFNEKYDSDIKDLKDQNNDLLIENKKFREKYDSDTKELNIKVDELKSEKSVLKKNNKKINKKLDKLNEDLNKKSIINEKQQNRIIELVSKLENNIIQSLDPNKKPMLLILYFQDSGNYKIVRGQQKRINSVKKQYQDTSQVFYCAYEPNPITFFDTLRTESIQENKLIFSGTNHFQLAKDYSQEEFIEDLEILGMTRLD